MATEAAGEVGPATEGSLEAEGPLEFDPQRPTALQLALAIETLRHAASDVVREVKVRSIAHMLDTEPRTMFALVTMSWGFWDDGSGAPHLWNGGLVTRDEPDALAFGPSPPVMLVYFDKAKLNPLAKARYSHERYQHLQVLAKIERVETDPAMIVLTPLVILSA